MQTFVPAEPLTFGTFNALVTKLVPGAQLIYHNGMIAYDRLIGPKFQQIEGLATAAYEAYQRGDILLTQRKIARNTYDYIATKRYLKGDNILETPREHRAAKSLPGRSSREVAGLEVDKRERPRKRKAISHST